MGSTGVLKMLMYLLNVVTTVMGLGIAAVSLWFFVEVLQLTSLRNQNHYLLDYKVYWPQIIPWIFFIAAVFVLCVSGCGFTSARRKNTGILKGYIGFFGFVIVFLIAVAIIALLFANSKASDDFVKDAIWDVFFQSKTDKDVEISFNKLEKKLQCCGSDSPRDYVNWKDRFPTSCCDVYYHGWLEQQPIICEFSNRLPNDRYGCATVAVKYSSIIVIVLSGLCLFTALIGVISIFVAISFTNALKKKRRTPATTQVEFESKKVLL